MQTTRTVRVLKKWEEAERIYGFQLADATGRALPAFSPGAHIDVRIPGGFVRQYSLCRHYTDDMRYEIAVLREATSRGGSEALCTRVKEGDELEISEPRNNFPLKSADHSILVAGGIGVTPILCMAERLASIGASFEFHYCTRARSKTAFLERVGRSNFAERVFHHFDDGEDAQKLDVEVLLAEPRFGAHVYVCGPVGFLEHVRAAAGAAGWPDANVHFEYFAPPADQAAPGASSFDVVIASSGMRVRVGAEESVCAALSRVGIDIPMSCEEGVCGTCLTRVIEGEPDHRDYVLSDAERATNDRFTPCCSRSKSARLVLDL